MSAARIVVEPDAESASRTAAELLSGAAAAGGAIALAGGSTPRRAYELAAGLAPDWGSASIWLGDERLVPPDDERSNRRLVTDSLLAHLTGQPTAHWIDTSLTGPEAASRYASELARARLDLALLGLGGDGHTASLFPGKPAIDEQKALAVSTEPGLEPWVERITLTRPALCAALQVVFLVTGASKAEAVRRAFVDPPSRAVPASLVRSASGATIVVLDEAAATLL